MIITAVRHGETIGNVEHLVQSRTGGELTLLGIEQARALGATLRDQDFDAVYVSDLARCQQTADYICEFLPKRPRFTTEQLRERSQGIYEGKCWEDLPWLEFEGDNLATQIPGGESWLQVEKRVADFLNEIYLKHPQEHVLLVTHGGVMKALRALLSDMDLRTSVDEMVPNGSALTWEMLSPAVSTVA